MKVTFPKVLFFLVLLLSSNVKFAFIASIVFQKKCSTLCTSNIYIAQSFDPQ
uniref:Uncharacterized protein n=1 Tax=Ascaris lumbricoides TaxID=6252 RepID=A0A0M3IWG7_ASCLU